MDVRGTTRIRRTFATNAAREIEQLQLCEYVRIVRDECVTASMRTQRGQQEAKTLVAQAEQDAIAMAADETAAPATVTGRKTASATSP